ncbi:MAG TPA: hypothetical protein VGI83_00275 [Gemmatimonadales bacterium]|jgi:preprotein translocase subunit SecD
MRPTFLWSWTLALPVLLVAQRGPMRVDRHVVIGIREALGRPGAQLEYRLVLSQSNAPAHPRGAIRDSTNRVWLTLSNAVLARLSDADSITLYFRETGGVVMFWPTARSAERMLEATTAHVGERMAITLNGALLNAPVIAGQWNGRWGVAAGTDSATGLALQQRLRASLRRR